MGAILVVILMDKIIEKLNKLGHHLNTMNSLDLEHFKEAYSVELPAMLDEYFVSIVGKKGLEVNHVFLCGIDDFKPISTSQSSQSHLDDSHFIIGDFDDWCWGYAIDVTSPLGEVFLIGRESTPLIKIADSLEQFLKFCIEDDKALLG